MSLRINVVESECPPHRWQTVRAGGEVVNEICTKCGAER